MERSCTCCEHHRYRHRMHNEGAIEDQQPSPVWPLVLLGVVFLLLMGPLVLESPEEVFSTSQIGAFFMLLPFLFLLAFYFFNSNSPSAVQDQYTHNSLSWSGYNGYSHNSPPPSEEPLYGWGLFLMFILAIVLLPLTRS